jgi:hypothetical protein
VLSGAITSGALSITVDGRLGADGIPDDAIIEIDSELIALSSVAGAVLTVRETDGRGYLHTTAASHADNSVVFVNPKFPRKNLFDALQSVITTLYPKGLYVRTVDSSLTYQTTNVLDLPAGTLDVMAIVVRAPGSNEQYTDVLMEGRDYRILWEFVPPKIRFIRGGYPNQTAHISIKKDFTLPTAETNELDTLNVPTTLQPYLPMAVAGWLLQGREIPRVQIEEIKRMLQAQGIQVGAALNVGQVLLRNFYNEAVGNERRRLLERDPTRFALRRA